MWKALDLQLSRQESGGSAAVIWQRFAHDEVLDSSGHLMAVCVGRERNKRSCPELFCSSPSFAVFVSLSACTDVSYSEPWTSTPILSETFFISLRRSCWFFNAIELRSSSSSSLKIQLRFLYVRHMEASALVWHFQYFHKWLAWGAA